MSSVRGGGFRGQGRGSAQSAQIRGRGSSNRGRARSSNTQHDTNTTGGFGKPSRQSASESAQSFFSAQSNASRQPASSAGAFGVAKTRGNWQERFQTLTAQRERIRNEAIRLGYIADPEKPRSLSEAITPVGTCQDMCAEYERVQRVVQKDVWDEETDHNQSAYATTDKEPDEARMVKKFRRAAAGLEEQLPSDLRPPTVLKRTCDYLFNEVIANAPSLAHVHHFVWDRTRAIRNDFSIQQVTKPEELRLAIECYERIARFHIVSLHQLALPERPYSKYDGQQEREQLDRTLLSLMQYYDDSRGRIELTNEAEFRAYCVIFQLQDPIPDLDDRIQTWPKNVIQDKRVQRAMDLYMAACNVMDAQGPLKPRSKHLIARQDWQRFWTLVASTEVSYLMACVAEIYFSLMRRTVLNALFGAFRMNSKLPTTEWTIEVLCDILAFDDEDEVYSFCERFGFSFANGSDGQVYLDLNSVKGRSLPEPTSGMPKQSKSGLVENKRCGRTLPAVINGLGVRRAEDLGLVTEEERDEDMEEEMQNEDAMDDGESLFVPETKSKSAAPQQNAIKPTESKILRPSPFSATGIGTSSFGKASAFGEQPSLFALNDTKKTAPVSESENNGSIFNFAKPAVNLLATDTKPATTFESTRSTQNPFARPTPNVDSMQNPFATPAPKFDFTQIASNNASKDTPAPRSVSIDEIAKEQPSMFATALAPAKSASSFSWMPTQQPNPGTKLEGSQSQLASPFASPMPTKSESRTPSPEQPKRQLTFSQASGPPAGPSATTSQQTELKPSQPQMTSTSPTSSTNTQPSSSSVLNVPKRSSFSTDTRPRKPSPLSHSFTANEDSNALARDEHEPTNERPLIQAPPVERQISSPAITAPAPKVGPAVESAEELDARLSREAEEVFYTPGIGLLTQFVEYEVRKTITEEIDRIKAEKDSRQADEWREFTLSHKYGTRWRDTFWRKRLAKTGRQRRDRRQRRTQQRGSQGADGNNLYDGKSSHGSGGAESIMDNMTGPIGRSVGKSEIGLRSSLDLMRRSQPDFTNGLAASGNKRSTDPQTAFRQLGHKRLKSTSQVYERASPSKSIPSPEANILSRSAFLGFSTTKNSNNITKDTTKSNYFRHKAMGLIPGPGSVESRGTKRQLSESLQLTSQTSPPSLRSASRLGFSPEQSTDAALMPPPSTTAVRVAKMQEEDDLLFARLKAAREALKETEPFSKAETAKGDEFRRSVSSQSSNESPSMARARMEARLRASQTPSESGREVPAYRLRESKFMPREQYGRAIDRAKEIRESRSRDTSRPASRSDGEVQKRESQGLARAINPSTARHGLEHDETFVGSGRVNGIQQHLGHELGNSTTMLPSFGANTSINFANHTTQMSSENPFLQPSIPNSFSNFNPQPTFSFASLPAQVEETRDHTIQPEQIRRSLANSFGSSHGFGQESSQPVNEHSPTPPEQNSYMQSQAISLLSDDGNDTPVLLKNNAPHYNATETDDQTEELVDEATDDEVNYGDYVNDNVYHNLARDANQEEDSQDQESEGEGQGSYDEDVGDGGSEDGFTEEERYLADSSEDEEDADGDIDEDEDGTEVDEEDYDEEDGCNDQLVWNSLQGQQYRSQLSAPSAKASALQEVGNTVEEAIELSD